MKIGDLVRYRGAANKTEWLGLIVREIPGAPWRKVIEWTHRQGGTDRGLYRARDLEVVNESR